MSEDEKRTLKQVQEFEFERRQLEQQVILAKLRQELHEAEASALQAQLTRDTLEAKLRKLQAGGGAVDSDDEESKGDADKARPFSFDPHKKRTKAADWEKLSQDILDDVTKHYKGDHGAARGLKEHVTKFRASDDYRHERLRDHKDKWGNFADGETGLIQEHKMGDFCHAAWGFHPQEFAIKYWKAMNAYDSSYKGITPEDFTELNHWFDEQSILWLDAPKRKVPDYSFNPNAKCAHAEDFDELSKGVANDARNFWASRSREEQQGHLNHTKRFREDGGYQKELFAKAFNSWVEIAPENGIIALGGRLHDFLHTQWGFNPGEEWSQKYWHAINAYNKTYQGIKVQDYLECWITFDRMGVEMLQVPDKEFPTYKFDPERIKPKADNYQELVADIVNDIRNHWKNEAKHKQFGHMDHLNRFKSRESYQNYKFQFAANIMDRLTGEGQNLGQDQIGRFLQQYWGSDMGDWGKKYWRAVSAYDSSYEGIKPEDFVECWIDWDRQGMDFFSEPDFKEEFVPKQNIEHADNFEELRNDIVKDIRNHWSSRIDITEGKDHKAHLEMFKDDDEQKTRLYRRVLSFWGTHDKDGDGLIQEEELPVFMGDMWGHNMGDWGKQYWRAVNAFDKSYQGVKAADFLICWIEFDDIAFKELEQKDK